MKNSIIAIIMALVLFLCGSVTVVCAETTDDAGSEIDYMILVNQQNPIPEDWAEKIEPELETVHNNIKGDDREFKVEKKTLEAFNALRDDLLSEGIDIELNMAYVTIAEQEEMIKGVNPDEITLVSLEAPGESEHHTGLAIDICLVIDGKVIDDENDLLMERDSLYAIHEKLHQYGFILRYPARTEEITGHDFEPWHFRYIGDLDAAFAIYDDDLTLEEYLGENPAE